MNDSIMPFNTILFRCVSLVFKTEGQTGKGVPLPAFDKTVFHTI